MNQRKLRYSRCSITWAAMIFLWGSTASLLLKADVPLSLSNIGSDPWINESEYSQLFDWNNGSENVAPEHSISLVTALLGEGKFDQALGQLRMLEVSHPTDFRISFLKSIALYGQFRYLEALTAANKCVRLAPNAATGYWLQGNVLTAQKEILAATKSFDDAVRIAPTNPMSFRQRAVFLITYRGNEPEQVKSAIRDVRSGVKLGMSPESEHGLLGSAYRKLSDAKRAEQHFLKLLEMIPDHHEAIGQLVELFDEQKRFEESEQLIRRAEKSVSSDSKRAKAQFSIVRAHHGIAVGDPVGVIEQGFRLALENWPDQSQWRREFAFWLEREGRQTEALPVLREGVAVSSQDPDLAAHLAWVLADSGGDTNEARRWMKIARRQYPDDPYMSDTEAWIEYRDGNYDAALSKLTPCLSLAERVPEIAYHAGAINASLGHREKAIEFLTLALGDDARYSGRREAETLLQQLRLSK